MRIHPYELELPLSDAPAGHLAHRRIEHLHAIGDIDPAHIVRLVRAFPSLAAVYSAPEESLARVVGPVVAARIRWFLDAPLETRLVLDVVEPAPRLRSAA